MIRKRTLIASALALSIAFGGSIFWTAQTVELGDDDVSISRDTSVKREEKKRDGLFAKVFKAPFKAIGKLFGKGKDEHKLKPLTEEDVAKFESTGVTALRKRAEASSGSRVIENANHHLSTGRALLMNGQLNEAIAELSLAVSLNPKLAEANNLLGIAYERKGLPERARESFQLAARSKPDDADALNNLGYALYLGGDYKEAVSKLKKAARMAPQDKRILNNLALAQFRAGKVNDASKTFTRAGGDLMGQLNTASMLERTGRDFESIQYYEKARQIEPNSELALKRLADLYRRAGRSAEADAAKTAAETIKRESTAVLKED